MKTNIEEKSENALQSRAQVASCGTSLYLLPRRTGKVVDVLRHGGFCGTKKGHGFFELILRGKRGRNAGKILDYDSSISQYVWGYCWGAATAEGPPCGTRAAILSDGRTTVQWEAATSPE